VIALAALKILKLIGTELENTSDFQEIGLVPVSVFTEAVFFNPET
jgi:hypothetical protein